MDYHSEKGKRRRAEQRRQVTSTPNQQTITKSSTRDKSKTSTTTSNTQSLQQLHTMIQMMSLVTLYTEQVLLRKDSERNRGRPRFHLNKQQLVVNLLD